MTSERTDGLLPASETEDGLPCPPVPVPEGALVRELKIINKKGLHARATAKFVQCADSFDAEITVTRCDETVGGTSIMGILTLGAGLGSTITVTSRGTQAEEALDALTLLVDNRFGEEE
jgi:phosphocarrier protein HPr